MNTAIDVTFRIFKGELIAFFPHTIENHIGNVMIYAHIGQHSCADYKSCVKHSRPALPNEYENLKKELENIGYNLNIVKRQNSKKVSQL